MTTLNTDYYSQEGLVFKLIDGLEAYEVTGFESVGSENHILVPEEYVGYPVIRIADSAFVDKTNINTIKLPDTYIQIGDSAFCGCTNLSSISLSPLLEVFDYHTVSGCPRLTCIWISEKTRIVNPVNTNVTFRFHEDYVSFTVRNGCIYVYDLNCNCESVFEIPEEICGLPISTISVHHLTNDENLAVLEIPSSIEVINYWFWNYSRKLKSIEVYNSYLGNHITSKEGVLYTSDFQTLIAFPPAKKGRFVLERQVRHIGNWAFNSLRGLISMELNDDLQSIGGQSFAFTKKLKHIRIPESLQSIDYLAFQKSSLESVTFLGNPEIIQNDIFEDSKFLSAVYINPTYPIITNSNFKGCMNLLTFAPSSEVEFPNVKFLEGVIYDKNFETLLLCPVGKKEINVFDRANHIHPEAFRCCNWLNTITLPESLRDCSPDVFVDCNSLEVIRGCRDSIAQTLAQQLGIKYEIVYNPRELEQ